MEIGDSFEYGSGKLLRYSSIGVENITFEFKKDVSSSWNDMRNYEPIFYQRHGVITTLIQC